MRHVLIYVDDTKDDPRTPPFWIAVNGMTTHLRDELLRYLKTAFEAQVPGRPAKVAAKEMLRLMEEDAHHTEVDGVPMSFLYHSLAAHNLAWQKAGIAPALGDAIAVARNRADSEEPTDE